MMLRKKTKEPAAKGCVVFLFALAGILLACFIFCTVLFQLNQANINPGTTELLRIFLG